MNSDNRYYDELEIRSPEAREGALLARQQVESLIEDVGVDTVMIRYPREGHGIREMKHIVDIIDRSIAWYEKQFDGAPGGSR